MIKKMVLTALVFGMLSGAAFAHPWKLIEDSYTVQKGDTLVTIAADYIVKNTYGKRDVLEFTEGIKELNPEIDKRDIQVGEKLHINYWIKNDPDQDQK